MHKAHAHRLLPRLSHQLSPVRASPEQVPDLDCLVVYVGPALRHLLRTHPSLRTLPRRLRPRHAEVGALAW
eukprot:3934284-Rhodomonas_salina.1